MYGDIFNKPTSRLRPAPHEYISPQLLTTTFLLIGKEKEYPMCCRYFVELSPELRPIVEAARQSSLASRMVDVLGKRFVSEGEIRPTDMVAVIAPDRQGSRKAFPMVWGFSVPGIKGPLVNARSESVRSRVSFRDSFKRRRCIVPASWYYEWEHHQVRGKIKTGEKYAIQPRGQEVTWLAGIYRIEKGHMDFPYPVFTILTREPSPDMKRIHDRMPVILPDRFIGDWLDTGCDSDRLGEILRGSLTDMVTEVTG